MTVHANAGSADERAGAGATTPDESMCRPPGRLAILIDVYDPWIGGAQEDVRLLSRALTGEGWEVTVLTRRIGGESPRVDRQDGVRIMRFGAPGPKILSIMRCFAGVTKYLISHKSDFDIVLAVPCAHYSDLLPAYVSGWVTGVPYVIRLVMAQSVPFMLAPTVRSVRQLVRALAVPPFVWRRTLQQASAVVWQSAALRQSASLPTVKHGCVIPNGIDTGRFHPATDEERHELRRALELPGNAVVIVNCARYSRDKNQLALLGAMALLTGRCKVPLYVVILGAHDPDEGDGIRRALCAFVAEYGLGEVVRLVDNARNVEAYLRASDLFVFPTVAGEGMPNAILEAMACGLPVVLTDLPQLRAMCSERGAVFVDPPAPDEIAQVVERLLPSASTRRRMGLAAAAIVRERYALEGVARQYDRLLRDVSEQPPGRPPTVEHRGAHDADMA